MTTTDPFSAYSILTPPNSLSTTPGVSLTPRQQLLTASILDLFAGHPSKRKLTLWADDASFHDPLTNATGREQFEAQWYGLKAAFSEIERLGVEVRSAGNPVEVGLKTRYKYAFPHVIPLSSPFHSQCLRSCGVGLMGG
jgi:hypothetical protein